MKSRYLLIALVLTLIISSCAPIKKAERLYKGLEFSKAVPVYEKIAASENKHSVKAYERLGDINRLSSHFEQSAAAYKKAIELKPDYEEPFEELGLLYALKGDRLAIDYLTSAININPQNLNAMYALGLFYQDHSMMQKALDTYQDIINIEPKHADALHNVGYINLVFKKSYTDALTLFTKAIEADTNFYQAYFNRGITYEHLNDCSKAQADFKKVLEIYPEHKLAKEHLN